MNGGRSAAVCSPNLMQRLSHLPTLPDVGPLRRRYFSPFPLCHKHHLESNPNFRWCCIDLLNAQRLSAKWIVSELPVTRQRGKTYSRSDPGMNECVRLLSRTDVLPSAPS